jgi:hypothetical protein
MKFVKAVRRSYMLVLLASALMAFASAEVALLLAIIGISIAVALESMMLVFDVAPVLAMLLQVSLFAVLLAISRNVAVLVTAAVAVLASLAIYVALRW